ncbi:MAG TPA: ATP-binding protein [Intrasporangium sp.]|uniref:sensor histidine kinase n=1 Tax=Intrasporangium sp. TaxID=1925024 RepID=UPI002D777BA6|nr:ATP-binding protein [Intrasporangium sp.]HET7398483.1 ATP-binding protein [Intrasporangium sp.]
MQPGDPLPEEPSTEPTGSELWEQLPDGLVVVSANGCIGFVNAEALRILECSAADLVGRHVTDALPLADKYGRDWWARTDPWNGLATRTGHREKLLVARDGREVLVTARYVRAERGGPVQRLMLGLRDAEARLRAERDQATVLSTVAHELRAPLTSVMGFTSSLLRRWHRFSDDQKRLMIETIEADATRLTRLIAELLDISRLDSDRLNLRLGPVDLEQLLARHVVRNELGRHPGTIRLHRGPGAEAAGLPELWADADRLDQVFFNLIENAVQHGEGAVDVTVDRDAEERGGVVVLVDDHGNGIPEDDREKIFGRFWHGPDNAGTGLGLYVANGLVRAHGGRIDIASSGSGGARFIVRLPEGIPGHFATG